MRSGVLLAHVPMSGNASLIMLEDYQGLNNTLSSSNSFDCKYQIINIHAILAINVLSLGAVALRT